MKKQSGFTLIELMIGLLVGLIVLSGVLYAFLSTLSSSRDILNSSKLNREASIILDSVTGELRRTGYFPVSLAISGTNSGFGTSVTDLYIGSSCILYSYYDESISSVASRGFRFDSGTGSLLHGVVSSTSSSACASVTSRLNSDDVQVERFDIGFECLDTSISSVVSSASCFATPATSKFTRGISLAVSLSIGSDWHLSVEEYVKIPNDYAAE